MSINLSALMKQRYDTAANWTAQNPTLLAGEIGIESDTKKWKVGTGATAWTSLAYAIGGTYPIVNADIAAGAAIVDTKLATIATAGKVSNSATTAASANTASAIVARDASGNFTAGTITAALTGAASSNVLKAGDTMTGVLAVTAGTAALPGIAVSGYPSTGIHSPGADQLAISTGGVGRLFVDASGNAGLGVTPNTWASNAKAFQFGLYGSLYQNASGYPELALNTYQNTSNLYIYRNSDVASRYSQTNGQHQWFTAPSGTAGNTITFTQSMTLDASGRLLVGTSSARSTANTSTNARVQIETAGTYAAQSISSNSNDATGSYLSFVKSRGTVAGSTTVVSSGDYLGLISFDGANGSGLNSAAHIHCQVDGTPGANDMPGRLIFSTTSDGASSPTARFQISSDGSFSSVIPAGSTLYPQFGCRAWVNFNGTGTVAIRASGNVSSITDNGVGDYTVNFTTAMPDANYTITSGMYDTNGTGNVYMTPQTWSTKATGSVKVFSSNLQGSANSVSRVDQAFIDVAIFR
jgi:hypothetical protein